MKNENEYELRSKIYHPEPFHYGAGKRKESKIKIADALGISVDDLVK